MTDTTDQVDVQNLLLIF